MNDTQLKKIQTTLQAEKLSEQIDKNLADLFKNASTKNPDREEGELRSFQKSISDLPVIKLIVASDPKPRVISTLSKWIKDKVDPYAIIDFEVEPEILGGAIISWKGKYKDVSISSKLDMYLGLNQ